ncbi:PREDICTED: separin [Papilio polytes]|uniref:separin n=1 Tax=Papilio polytes TaxID=76194 RepID=UPI000675D6BB|nr:PREDICTED: separin [Papilio polytes]
MEDFDVFTDEIEFTETLYKNVLNKYVKNIPSTPSGPNYQSSRKLYAEQRLAENNEAECAFYLSEAVSASVRTLAVYRDEQIKASASKTHKIASYIKPKDNMTVGKPKLKSEKGVLDFLSKEAKHTAEVLNKFRIDDELPFYKQYMRFGPHNNTENLLKILKELPKEWTIIQLTAAYNPNENLKPQKEFKTEISSFYLTMLKNDYIDMNDVGPLTVNIPAYVHKEGEKPLFTELYSLLEDNYNTIGKAQFINKKRLVQNYWNKREDIDLRMKGVISAMERDWVCGWSALLTGALRDAALRDNLVHLVDNAIADWGFLKLTIKQKTLLYNLIDSCHILPSNQIKSCIRRILTEHGNTEDIRKVIDKFICKNCNKQFKFPNELCLKCLSKCFEEIHHVSLVTGIKAFSQVATQVKENSEWATLKTAKRWPVILIVDELLDTFPWEMLSCVREQAVCRMENIHFTYYLYKTHEKQFVDGHMVIKADVGRYIINPEKNLERMEKRMTSFVQYWCAAWRGHVGQPPAPTDFIQYLNESDIFLYCGHGDGCQLAGGGGGGGGGGGVESAAGRGAALLSGCGSVRLTGPAGRAPPAAAHHHLHIAACPLVVGMLWEVTDLEVDKAVSSLVALCVPPRPPAPAPWHAVGKQNWSQGVLDTNVEYSGEAQSEPEVLLALSRARSATAFTMIASSMVARGLPLHVAQH